MDLELSWMVCMCRLLQKAEGKTLSVFLASLASLASLALHLTLLIQMALVGLH